MEALMGWHTQDGLMRVGVGKACHRKWPLSPEEGGLAS